jgi:hypothetical protein
MRGVGVMVYDSPEIILVAQHGWADNNCAMLAFGRAVASPTTSWSRSRLAGDRYRTQRRDR